MKRPAFILLFSMTGALCLFGEITLRYDRLAPFRMNRIILEDRIAGLAGEIRVIGRDFNDNEKTLFAAHISDFTNRISGYFYLNDEIYSVTVEFDPERGPGKSFPLKMDRTVSGNKPGLFSQWLKYQPLTFEPALDAAQAAEPAANSFQENGLSAEKKRILSLPRETPIKHVQLILAGNVRSHIPRAYKLAIAIFIFISTAAILFIKKAHRTIIVVTAATALTTAVLLLLPSEQAELVIRFPKISPTAVIEGTYTREGRRFTHSGYSESGMIYGIYSDEISSSKLEEILQSRSVLFKEIPLIRFEDGVYSLDGPKPIKVLYEER